MIFDTYTPQMVDVHVKAIMELIRRGKGKEQIAKQLKVREFDELFSIAKARVTATKLSDDYFFTEEDLRFATNEHVAAWRAERLACNTLVDIGCGVGIQTVAFARTCKRVIAVDIDGRKIRYALENAKKADVNNIEFVHGDGLKALLSLPAADVVFVDPQRPPEERARSLSTSFRPSIPSVISAASRLTDKVAIELPPQIQDIPFDCEREYLSVDHELNRLTIYLDGLKKHAASAALLPGKHVLSSNGLPELRNSSALTYLYEVDPAVAKAGLTGKLADAKTFLYSDVRETLLTSNTLHKSPYFKAAYQVVDVVDNTFEEILSVLLWENAGKVILRQKLAPERYWAERRKYESRLKGDTTLYVFAVGHEAVICKKLDSIPHSPEEMLLRGVPRRRHA